MLFGLKVCHLGLFLLQYILHVLLFFFKKRGLPFGLVSSPITLNFIVTEIIKQRLRQPTTHIKDYLLELYLV